MRSVVIQGAVAIVGMLVCACGAEPEPTEPADCAPPTESLRWKRADALTRDLMAALELEPDSLCFELGALPCRDVHGIALGAREPFRSTLYEPLPRPIVITPLAMDRIAMSACENRVAFDRSAPLGERVVFTELDLNAPSLDPRANGVDASIRELYRRLVGRDASDEEVGVVAQLATADRSAETFATLACSSIATTTEFLFF